jgi:uncharacterized protein (TIGR00369 family)
MELNETDKERMDDLTQKITNDFEQQQFMATIGAQLLSIEKGKVKIQCRFREDLSQQNGYFHAGVITSLIDVACGYAALSMYPERDNVLSAEFKINLMRSAKGGTIIATGEVLKAGNMLTICEGLVTDEKEETIYAKMVATMICK